MASFHFEEAAYSHCCSKIETADEIRTCANRNFQNEYLEKFLSNLLFLFKIRVPNFTVISMSGFESTNCSLKAKNYLPPKPQ